MKNVYPTRMMVIFDENRIKDLSFVVFGGSGGMYAIQISYGACFLNYLTINQRQRPCLFHIF